MKNNAQTQQESIRALAYLLSEQAGHPPGRDKYFWFQAEAIVLAEVGASNGTGHTPKSGSPKTRTKRNGDRSPVPVKSGKSAGRKAFAREKA